MELAVREDTDKKTLCILLLHPATGNFAWPGIYDGINSFQPAPSFLRGCVFLTASSHKPIDFFVLIRHNFGRTNLRMK